MVCVEKKEMVETFGAAFTTARAERVLMGRGSGHKYRVKWINLSEEHIRDGANHGLLQDPSKELPLKVPKIHGLQRLSLDQENSSHVSTNTVDALDFCPSSGEISDAYDDDPQFQVISPYKLAIMF